MTHKINALIVVLIIVTVWVTSAKAESALESCEPSNAMTFVNWDEWTQVTHKPVASEGHSGNWVGIFVDELARGTYLSADAPYPECAKVVKPVYSDGEGTTVLKLTVMVKMAAGYDPENGDWWYATYDASGTYARKQGKLEDCISCHKLAAETDYLFSRHIESATHE